MRNRSFVIVGLALVVLSILLLAGPVHAQLTPPQQSLLLGRHNNLRSTLGVGSLSGQPGAANMIRMNWDAGLASVAQSWASQCRFEHNSGRGNAGENLALVSGNLSNSLLTASVDLWWDENMGYTYRPFSVDDLQFGHYTQLAWAHTRAIGCGAQFCLTVSGGFSNATLVVCNYSPPGNFINQTPYSVGPACSQCPSDRPWCTAGLCSDQAPAQVPALGSWLLLPFGIALMWLGVAFATKRSRPR